MPQICQNELLQLCGYIVYCRRTMCSSAVNAQNSMFQSRQSASASLRSSCVLLSSIKPQSITPRALRFITGTVCHHGLHTILMLRHNTTARYVVVNSCWYRTEHTWACLCRSVPRYKRKGCKCTTECVHVCPDNAIKLPPNSRRSVGTTAQHLISLGLSTAVLPHTQP